MEMNIVPFEKVGDLLFGAKREEVRKLLGPDFETFRKAQWSTNTTDDYSALGLHLYYNKQDELEFVEMFPPAIPKFKEINLLQGTIEEVVKILQTFDANPETDGASYVFYKIGISLYSESEDKSVEAVSAFAKDYYSS
jgi:hypothetical protein